jgi:hypothetical protein
MKILTFGDSHSKLLAITNELKEINPHYKGISSEVISLSGATISGFGKRHSTLNASQLFLDKVDKIQPDVLCFALGQVDIELGYYYRRVIKGNNVEFKVFSIELLERYIENIKLVTEKLGYSKERVIFKGVNLPVLSNSRAKAINYTSKIITENVENSEERAMFREKLSKMFPSNLERAYYHIAFNESLKKYAQEVGMKYFDINSFVEDEHNKCTVDLKYIPAGDDHHLVDSLYMRIIHINALLHTIFRVAP